MNSRLYRVDAGERQRLVRAVNKAQALAHVARTQFAIRVASQDDLCELVAAGVKPEAATLALDPSE
jgi:hypothetical protein